MKLGRVLRDSAPTFVASSDGDRWFSISDLGIDAADTAAVIGRSGDIEAAMGSTLAQPVDTSRGFLSPVVRPSKIFGIGLNYMDHIRETGASTPDVPVVFAKFPNALTGPSGEIVLRPSLSVAVDYEVEVAAVIGRPIRDATEEDALNAVFGYCVANDVSARDIQRAEAQFSRSKSFDTFCPIGPWITSADEVGDPQALRLTSTINGELRQDSTTAEMIFSVAQLIAFLSQGLTLEPGDVILTGTPHGVGFAMDPPRYLAAGDIVRCDVEKLGYIENAVVNGEP